jgi:hypothetical protein
MDRLFNVQTRYCSGECQKRQPFVEELADDLLSYWHCLVCGYIDRPGGNSLVLATGGLPKNRPGTGGAEPEDDNMDDIDCISEGGEYA